MGLRPSVSYLGRVRGSPRFLAPVSQQSLSYEKVFRSVRFPYGRPFRTGDSSVRKALPCGSLRLLRMEASSIRKTLPYRRVFRTEPFRTEDFSVCKPLPYGRLFRTEESSVCKTLPYGRLFRKEDSSVRKTLRYGRVFRTEEPFVRTSLPQCNILWADPSMRRGS